MNTDDFESRLSRQPLRTPPPDWRQEILAAAEAPSLARQERESASAWPSDARRSAAGWWFAWLNPSRPGWIALGAAWLLIAVLHLASDSADVSNSNATVARTTPAQWLASRQLMAELIDAVEPAKPVDAARPRSERRNRTIFHFA
jgi:hypothetical protein